jgi:hypothetical protein
MMALTRYDYYRIQGNQKNKGKLELYRFKNDFKQIYIVEIFHYEHNVYAVKFYLKNHSDSKRRYNLCYKNDFKEGLGYATGNSNFIKVLNTILSIVIDIIKKDKLASFGFMGAPRENEMDESLNAENINEDCTVANTKRYKVYHLYVRKYFNPEDFEYIDSKTSSILLLRNNKNKDVLTEEVAEDYIVNTIIPSL